MLLSALLLEGQMVITCCRKCDCYYT